MGFRYVGLYSVTTSATSDFSYIPAKFGKCLMSNLSEENYFCPVCTFNLHKAFNQALGNVHDFYVADPELYQLIDGIKKVIKFRKVAYNYTNEKE